MTAIDTAFALVFVALGSIILFFVGLAGRALYLEAHPNEMAMCTPSRRANITASVPQAQRCVVIPLPACAEMQATVAAQLPPDMAWDDELQDWAPPKPQPVTVAVCTPSRYDVLTMQRQHSMTYDLASLTAPAVPELSPVAVPVAVPVVEEEEQSIPWTWPVPEVVPVPLRSR